MEKQQLPQSWLHLMKQNFPLRQFIVGAVIPILIFYICYRLDRSLSGALLAIGWEVGVLLITNLIFRHINLFAALAIPFTLIELIVTVVTLNPDYYLASEAIEHVLWGLIYLGSLLFSRPLILIFAEAMVAAPKSKEMDGFGDIGLYRSSWIILTAIWGIVYIIASVLLLLSQFLLPLETFLIIRTILGTPLLVVMLGFSFWFPDWYWRRNWSRPVKFPKFRGEIQANNKRLIELGKWEIRDSSVMTPDGKMATFSAVINIQNVSNAIVKGQYTVTGDIETDVPFSSKITNTRAGLQFSIRSFNMDVPCRLEGEKKQMATPGGIIVLSRTE